MKKMAFLICVATLLLFWQMGVFLINKRRYRKKMLLENHLQSENIQYSNVVEESSRLNVIRHDLQKHIDFLSSYSKETDYIEHILHIKQEQAKKAGINIWTEYQYPTMHDVTAVDMVSLLGNLIDNAIEACERYAKMENEICSDLSLPKQTYSKTSSVDGNQCDKAEDKKWRIHVTVANQNTPAEIYLSIRVENRKPLQEKVSLHQGTSKENPENHGYGMKIILEIVNKYHGTLSYYDKGESFLVECSIPTNTKR